MRSRQLLTVLAAGVCALAVLACESGSDAQESGSGAEGVSPGATAAAARRIEPGQLTYQGAFRLPDGPEEYAWGWSGQGLAYHPDGDAEGEDDGYGGSLFGTGHNWNTWVSEVSIPRPVISPTRNVEDLNTARTLQQFADIRGNLYEGRDLEQPRVGLVYLPPQGEQTAGKLYFCWAAHMGQGAKEPTHGWCEPDLSNPRPAGLWSIAGLDQYLTCDYITTIPRSWADANTPGMELVTGRMRDGGQASQGPTLIAYGPWNQGNPPAAGAELPGVVLLRYSAITDEQQNNMNGYAHSDDWSGVAWLDVGGRSAVAFVGTKGVGECWYGFANGVVWPEGGPYPPVPEYPNDQRGWWSERFVPQIMLYDPADLAAVAAGKAEPHEPQPYAVIDIDELMFRRPDRPDMHRVGAVAADNERGLLYVIELRGDEDKSLIHVWKIAGEPENIPGGSVGP